MTLLFLHVFSHQNVHILESAQLKSNIYDCFANFFGKFGFASELYGFAFICRDVIRTTCLHLQQGAIDVNDIGSLL